MQGAPSSPSANAEVMELAYAGTTTSLTVTLRGPEGAEVEDIPLAWTTDEYRGTRALPSYPQSGLWFVAEATVTTDKGSTTRLSRDSAHGSFSQSIETSTGATLVRTMDLAQFRVLAQAYVPPEGGTFLNIEGYQNGSTVGRVDPVLRAYRVDDTTYWFAANDDGGRGELMPVLRLSVTPGERVYVEAHDFYRHGGAYSIRASLSVLPGSTTETITADGFEPDDAPTTARELPLDTFQPHLFQAIGESDWLVIDVPE